jgi:hypothetical protein
MRLAWHDAVFEVPDRWEVTRYSLAPQAGRLEFADRHGARGVFAWERCSRLPDLARTLAEFHRRNRKAPEQGPGLATRRVGAFLAGCPADGEPCQAVTCLERESKLLVWTFPDFSREEFDRTWRPILESFRPNDGAWRDWSLFGLRCRLPRDFELEAAACKPADVWLAFERKNLHKIDLHRWGLPRELLRARDLDAFFRDVIRGHEGRVLDSRPETFRGMESVAVTAELRGTHGMERLYAARWRGAGRIWHDREEQRLYAWVQSAPAKVALLEEEEIFA